MAGFFKRNGAVLMVVLASLGIFGYSSMQKSDAVTEVREWSAKVAEASSDVDAAGAALEKETVISVTNTTGFDMDRYERDSANAERVMKDATTWESYDEYMAARAKLVETYGVEPNGDFLTKFMPEIPNRVAGGKNYNHIDVDGLRLKYSNLKTYVTRIDGSTYSWLAVCDIESISTEGTHGKVSAVLTYTTDAEGNVHELKAVATQ